MDTTISAYHSADCPEVIRGVACSGGIGADGRPLLVWRQRFSGCTPRAVTYSLCGRLSHRPTAERALKLSARVGGLSVADVVLGAVTDHFGLIRTPGGFFRLWLKNFFHRLPAPARGKKERNHFK